LAQFIPHMVAYFQRDKLDKQIAYTINIIEQAGTAPFNRGKLANCGFALTQDGADYIAFTTSIICRCGPTIPGRPTRRG
jgi:N-terminal region of glycosyl transferase group 7